MFRARVRDVGVMEPDDYGAKESINLKVYITAGSHFSQAGAASTNVSDSDDFLDHVGRALSVNRALR